MNLKDFYCLAIFFVFTFSALYSGDIYSLIPKAKISYRKQGNILLSSLQSIVVPDDTLRINYTALNYLQKLLKQFLGNNLPVVSDSNYSTGKAIILGEINSFDLLKKKLNSTISFLNQMTYQEGYVLDISPDLILLGGYDKAGTFNGVSTLIQLIDNSGKAAAISCANVFDYPDYPDRWVIAFHNLQVAANVTALTTIMDTMAFRKLNGLQHGDFKYNILDIVPSWYFDDVKQFKSAAHDRNVEVIPGVANIGWSDGILYKHPYLAEGIPTSSVYVMESDTGRLIPDPNVSIPNGGFENVDGKGNFTGFGWYDPVLSQDKTVFHSGTASAHGTNFTGSNCRASRNLKCQPYRGYLLSAWVKTKNFKCNDEVKLLALGGDDSRSLTSTSLGIGSTQDWTKCQVIFNTLGNTNINIYIGAWGATGGEIWFDDFQIQDIGLMDVLRRKGTPVTSKNKTTNLTYNEGSDYEYLVDKTFLSYNGSIGPFHTAPAFKRVANGMIHNGDSVIISSYHPYAAVSGPDGNNSVMVCVSDDSLYTVLADQMQRVNQLYYLDKFFMGHDEIRNLGWDKACQDRKLTAAQLLGDNITKCDSIIKTINKNATVYMWNDMVDSLHNAHNNYYLINGDLTGIWNDVPKSIVIANWNGGNAKQSLTKFSEMGFSQITSPYYDDHSTNNIRTWRLAQEGINNVLGMMYTTWATDYSQLTPFSYYAWGAGPVLFHQPVETLEASEKQMDINLKIIGDLYDSQDNIESANIMIEYTDSSNYVGKSYVLKQFNGSNIVPVPQDKDFKYTINVFNNQNIRRKSPTYLVKHSSSGIINNNNGFKDLILSVYPNIIKSQGTIELTNFRPDYLNIKLYDCLGNFIKYIKSGYFDIGNHTIEMDLSEISSGVYFVNVSNGNNFIYVKFVIMN